MHSEIGNETVPSSRFEDIDTSLNIRFSWEIKYFVMFWHLLEHVGVNYICNNDTNERGQWNKMELGGDISC